MQEESVKANRFRLFAAPACVPWHWQLSLSGAIGMSNAMKKCLVLLGVVTLVGSSAFAGMLSFPQFLPESWAAPSVAPPNLSPEEVDANCCERVKFKWRNSTCEGDCHP